MLKPLIAAFAVLAVVAGLWAFEPWRLFTSSTVDEAAPTSAATASTASGESKTTSPGGTSTAAPPPRDRVLAPDQRGYSPGARPRGRRAYAVAELVDDIVALLDTSGLEKVHLVGHDWGALVAWSVASAHPDRLHSVTAVSVPHPGAFFAAMPHGQILKSWYMGVFQIPLLAERLVTSDRGVALLGEPVAGEDPLEAGTQRGQVDLRRVEGGTTDPRDQVVADLPLLAPVAVEVEPAPDQAHHLLAHQRAATDALDPCRRLGPRQLDLGLERHGSDGLEVEADRARAHRAHRQRRREQYLLVGLLQHGPLHVRVTLLDRLYLLLYVLPCMAVVHGQLRLR